MAIISIYKDDEDYILEGQTNTGRPLRIELKIGDSRKYDVFVEPAFGSPTDEPFAEIELQNVMIESEAIERRISTIFETMPRDTDINVILAQISSVASKQKITADEVENLISYRPNLAM